MVKLIKKGVYYIDGKLVKANEVNESAKKKTLAYKILSSHNTGDDKKLKIKFK